MADHLVPQGAIFLLNIVYRGIVGEDDETYSTFRKALKTYIVQISPWNPMQF
jgi:hypothetical protein